MSISLGSLFYAACLISSTAASPALSRPNRDVSNSRELPLSTMIKMTRADFDCGTGCYKIAHQTILDEVSLSDILRVDVYFYDFGSLKAKGQHLQDVFEIQKINCHRHRNDISPSVHSLRNFTLPDYDLYNKSIRIVNITHFATSWLRRHTTNDVLHLKIRKLNDILERDYRFAYSEGYLPTIIVQSRYHGDSSRQRRSVSESSPVTPLCTAENDKTTCCRQPVEVTRDSFAGIFSFAELTASLTVHKCAGTCPTVVSSMNLDGLIDTGSRKCCTKLYGSPIPLTIHNGDGLTETQSLINATHCTCE